MICHVDADAFFASVLERLHPHLKGKPLFALGMGGTFIIAANYSAKAKGVKTGMPIKDARRLCPGATEMPSDFRETGLASEQIEAVLTSVCPRIEQMSIDEWYLDLRSLVGGVPADTHAWGAMIQKLVLQKTGLSVSVGIAPTKTLSKLAGETRKPAGVMAVDRAGIDAFLRTRPLEAVCGIGRRRAVPAHAQGWKTAYDFARGDPNTVQSLFGKCGRELQEELCGNMQYRVDDATVPPKSVSRCRSFPATGDATFVWSHLLGHLSRTVLRMRRWRLAATHVNVWVRTSDYEAHGAAARLLVACNDEGGALPSLRSCFQSLVRADRRYTQVGLAFGGLVSVSAKQQSLFDSPETIAKDAALQQALDAVRERFGKDTITRAATLPVHGNVRPSFDVPLLTQ